MEDMTRDELKELALRFLKHLSTKTLFITKDGQVFILEGHARFHAQDKLVVYKAEKSGEGVMLTPVNCDPDIDLAVADPEKHIAKPKPQPKRKIATPEFRDIE